MIKLTNSQIEKALLYVTGKMNASDRLHFEKDLADNLALQSEVKLQKGLLHASKLAFVEKHIEQARIDNIIDKKSTNPAYKNIHQKIENAQESNESENRRFRKLLVLGALLLLIISGIGIKSVIDTGNQLEKSHNFFLESEQDEKSSPPSEQYKFVSAREKLINKKVNDIRIAAKAQDWDQTIHICNEIENKHDFHTDEIAYYKGIALHFKKESSQSIKILEGITGTQGPLSCRTQHLLVLCYLDINDKAKAYKQFENMKNNTNSCNEMGINDLQKYF